MSREHIEAVIAKVPQLNDFGIGLFGGGKGKTAEQREVEFKQNQEDLLNNVEVFERVCEWLARKEKIKSKNPHHTSYGLKHIAEQQIGTYVTNGVFIAAAIHCGFPYYLIPDSPNVQFGISEKSLKSRQ